MTKKVKITLAMPLTRSSVIKSLDKLRELPFLGITRLGSGVEVNFREWSKTAYELLKLIHIGDQVCVAEP